MWLLGGGEEATVWVREKKAKNSNDGGRGALWKRIGLGLGFKFFF